MAGDVNDELNEGPGIDGIGAEEFAYALLRHASDAIAVSDRASGRYLVVSDSYCALTGYARHELIGRTSVEVGLVAGHADRAEALDQADRHPTAMTEMHIRRKDGAIRLFEFSVQRLAGGLMLTISRDMTERERARARFHGLLEAAPVAIIACDVHWRVALANAQAEQLFGYPPGELVGCPVADLFPEYVEAVQAGRRPRFATGVAPGEIVAIKLAARRRDGAEFFAEMSLTTIETDEGWLALAGVRDASERELAAIVESSPDAIIGKTLDGVITSWNRGAEEMYGWTASEMIGRNVSTLIPPDRHDELERLLVVVAEGERIEHLETQRIRKDGSRFDISLSVSPIRDAGGVIVGGSAVARDITATKREVDARLASEARKSAILNAALDCIISIDHAGRVVEFNPAAEQVFGYSRQDAIGREMAELIIPPGVRDEHRVGLARYLANGEGPILGERLELEAMRADGSVFPAEVAITRVDLPGPPIFTGYLRDLTERNRIRAELANAEQRRRQSERLESLGQLAGGIAHDFNNLLNMISSYAGFVAEEVADNETARSDVEQITAAAERAARLTRQLLLFAKRGSAQPEILDLNAVLSDTAKLLSRTIGPRIAVVARPESGLPAIRADRGQVEQVLLNLAVNARDAMPEGGTLIMQTRQIELDEEYCRLHPEARPGSHVELSVSDTGTGMSGDVLTHAFEPFFTTKPKGEGTGLGLATVYGILTEAGGSLSVDSEPGQGTTFRAYFPALDVTTAVERSTPAVRSTVPGGTILVVEDEPVQMTIIARILRRNGFTVLEATNSTDALRLITAHDLHLVLTDSVVPQTAGRRLAEEIAELRPELPILVVSGQSQGVPRSGQPAGMDVRFIQKPFNERALVDTVRAILTDEERDTPA